MANGAVPNSRLQDMFLVWKRTYKTSRTKYIDIGIGWKGRVFLNVDEMKKIDVTKVKRTDLVDVKDVRINRYLKQERQINDFVTQIKNPYCYKYGDYIVKIGFEDTGATLTDRLKELVLKTANSM